MERKPPYEPGRHVPGTVYRVLRLLGAGGMGVVYEVEDTTVGKGYVMKLLHADLCERTDLAVRIKREARTLARLHHPNIIDVVTAGVADDTPALPFFVMERLSGYSLRAILGSKGRLMVQTALSIAIDLLDALDHAHGHGIVHRDVKPDNVFIHRNSNGTHLTKLLDFGIFKLVTEAAAQTAGRFVGTFRYAAPEQLQGTVSPSCDLYSAALVLYEMLAGRGPFDDERNDAAIASAHLLRAPEPPSRFRPEIPPELDAVMMSALAKDPSARPRDAFAFAAALRAIARRPETDGSQTTVEGVLPVDDETLPRASTVRDEDPPETTELAPPPAALSIDRQATTGTASPLEPSLVGSSGTVPFLTDQPVFLPPAPPRVVAPRPRRGPLYAVAAGALAAGLALGLLAIRPARAISPRHAASAPLEEELSNAKREAPVVIAPPPAPPPPPPAPRPRAVVIDAGAPRPLPPPKPRDPRPGLGE